MGWFRKKADPIEQRVKELERELSELRGEIDRCEDKDSSAANTGEPPTYRSSYYPGQPQSPSAASDELILEADDQSALQKPVKYLQEKLDGLSAKPSGLRAKIKELKENVGASPTANPNLLKYLSSGNLEGLQPLRREKRIARNRVLFLTILLALVLLGLASVLLRDH